MVPQLHAARRGSGGRLRRGRGSAWPGQDPQVSPVHAAPVVFGQGGAPGVRPPVPGGVPGGPRSRRSRSWAGSRPAHIRYDNLQAGGEPGVLRADPGGDATVDRVSLPLRVRRRSTACPASDGAHEKGGVESEGGRFRRTPPRPRPRRRQPRRPQRAHRRHRRRRGRPPDRRRAPGPVGVMFAVESAAAGRAARRGVRLRPHLDADGVADLPGHGAAVLLLGPGPVHRPQGPGQRCAPTRCSSSTAGRSWPAIPAAAPRGDYRDDLDHYLEILLAKPGAWPGSTALARPAPTASSPLPTRRSGTPPAPPTATPPAPAP